MKLLNVALCVLAIVTIAICDAPVAKTDDWMKYSDECKKKTSASDDDVKVIINRQVPKTKECACFLACTKKMTGIMTADNKLNMTQLTSVYAPMKTSNKDMYDKVIQIFEECRASATPETDECVAAKNFASCIVPKKDALLKAYA